MKKKNFSEAQIVSILKTQETSRTIRDMCREHDISDATFSNRPVGRQVGRQSIVRRKRYSIVLHPARKTGTECVNRKKKWINEKRIA
jgi:hypothetical protein